MVLSCILVYFRAVTLLMQFLWTINSFWIYFCINQNSSRNTTWHFTRVHAVCFKVFPGKILNFSMKMKPLRYLRFDYVGYCVGDGRNFFRHKLWVQPMSKNAYFSEITIFMIFHENRTRKSNKMIMSRSDWKVAVPCLKSVWPDGVTTSSRCSRTVVFRWKNYKL